MTIKKYSAAPGYLPFIGVVDVDRESDTHVWIDGTKGRKSSIFMTYHDTFEQAKDHLLRLATADCDSAAGHLHRKQKARKLVIELTPFENKEPT